MVDGNNWRAMIEGARDKVLPVAERSIQVDEFASGLAKDAIKFPQCSQLLEFEIDPVSMKDSSAEMFGQSFMLMSDKDLNAAIQYVNECLLFVPDYAQAVKGWREAQGKEHLNKIMDKPLIILKRRLEWRDWEKRPSDLIVQDEFGRCDSADDDLAHDPRDDPTVQQGGRTHPALHSGDDFDLGEAR